jgi:F0F1-type ATP synthase assembly protein I
MSTYDGDDRRSADRTIGQLTYAVEALTKEIHEIKIKVDNIEAQANKWKGAFAVIVALGAVLGWFADKLAGLFVR